MFRHRTSRLIHGLREDGGNDLRSGKRVRNRFVKLWLTLIRRQTSRLAFWHLEPQKLLSRPCVTKAVELRQARCLVRLLW